MARQLDDETPDSGNKSSSFGLGTVLRGIRRHSIISFVFFLATLAAAAGVWFFLPLPKMTAYAIFHISSQPQGLLNSAGTTGIGDFNNYRQTQAALITGRGVLGSALKNSNIADNELLRQIPKSQQIDWLQNKLKVDFKLSPEYMRISLEGDLDNEIKEIVAAVAKAYKSKIKEIDDNDENVRKDGLRNLMKKLNADLKTRQDFLAALQQAPVFVDDLESARRQFVQAQSDLRLAKSEAESLRDKLNNIEKRPISAEVVTSALQNEAGYLKLVARQSQIREAVEQIRKTIVPGAKPEILIRREKELADIDGEIKTYADQSKPKLNNQLRESERRATLISLEHAEDRLRSVTRLHDSLQEIINKSSKQENGKTVSDAGQIDLAKAGVAEIQSRINQIQQMLDAMDPLYGKQPRVTVSDEADLMAGIEGNRRLKYTLMAGGVVLLLGLSLVTFLEVAHRRIVAPEEIWDNLGLKLIGTVPSIPERTVSLSSGDPKSVVLQSIVAESVDSARVMLLHAFDSAKPIRTLLVTSALPGEGKTMLACNLASSLARAGFKTLLIDGDLRRPSLHHLFEAPSSPGLCELLRGEANPGEAIQNGVVPNLSFVPAGVWSGQVRQMLAGNCWKSLKTKLESGFEYVVIDSSPLLLVTDPLLVARETDGVVMSVLRNVSQIGAVAEARDRLKSVGVKVLGVVVNGFDKPGYRASLPYYQASLAESAAAIDSISDSTLTR